MSSYFLFTSRQLEMFPYPRFVSPLLFVFFLSMYIEDQLWETHPLMQYSDRTTNFSYYILLLRIDSVLVVSCVLLYLICPLVIRTPPTQCNSTCRCSRALSVCFPRWLCSESIYLPMTLSDCQFFSFLCVYNTI
jgi:hypothetical protein